MVKFTVSKKTGFSGRNVRVYDKRGLFYRKDGDVTFNLPPGSYTGYGIKDVIAPVKYRTISLPFPEKLNFMPPFESLKIKVVDNVPFKAAIDIARNLILVNSKLLRLTTPAIACVMYHELGHYHYYAEEYCDLFAVRELVKLGMNPSQFVHFVDLLNNTERAEIVAKYAENIHGK